MTPPPPIAHHRLSRRGFLIGVTATGVLAACGSESASSTPAPDPDTPEVSDSAITDTYTIAMRFPRDVQEPGPQRLPISLASSSGALVQDGPDSLGAQVTDIDGTPLGDRITAARRDGAPAPYYDFRPDIAEAGFYYLVVDGGPAEGAAIQVMEPDTVTVPGRGQPLPPFDTPTTSDARGVDPICTREPEPCPFHEVTLTEALASGKGVVYLVGTPAFCQTGTCAPALESIVDIHEDFADQYVFVHSEVYIDNTATTPAPAVEAAGLTYEPALFITDSAGNVVARLDAVWNTEELLEILETITPG